jgi:aspartyl-tRNA(Asn)/glutamyl-tRNA(Gln) amidotransferase subunit A
MPQLPEPQVDLGVDALLRAYRSGASDPVQVAQYCLARIGSHDPDIRAFITVSGERALADARASRERWRSGQPLGPCDGIPIALKDNIDVAGLPCTAGTEAFRHRRPARDAAVARRLAEAGAVLLGKLNMHEAALGATTDNPAYGRCMNPLRIGHTPGGSSGGSGAAVAAGFASMAVGTDTMGSIRIPAAYCGVFGFKPGGSAALNAGIVPLHPDFDVPGPLARSARDLASFAPALLGRSDLGDGTTPLPQRGWRGLRVMRIEESESIGLDPTGAHALDDFARALEQAGARIERRSWPEWQPGAARRAGLLLCEQAGFDWWSKQLGDGLPGLSSALSKMLRYPSTLPPGRLEQAHQSIDRLRAGTNELFESTDLILLATSPGPSFPHGENAPAHQADLTALANFLGAPALAIPIDAEGGARSVQLMAAPGADALLLSLAQAIDGIGKPSRTLPFARRVSADDPPPLVADQP